MEFEPETSSEGIREISHKTFEKETFSQLMLQGKESNPIYIRDIQFLDCRTSPGTAWLGGHIKLEDVVFDNFDCGDALRINSECHCRRVTVTGKRPKAFFVRPDDGITLDGNPMNDAAVFDISNYTGKVEIIGYAGPEVKKNADRHVSIYSHWKDAVDWKKLGIGRHSYWCIWVQKVEAGSAGRGVFSLPSPKSKYYQETIEERATLESSGLCFD